VQLLFEYMIVAVMETLVVLVTCKFLKVKS